MFTKIIRQKLTVISSLLVCDAVTAYTVVDQLTKNSSRKLILPSLSLREHFRFLAHENLK